MRELLADLATFRDERIRQMHFRNRVQQVKIDSTVDAPRFDQLGAHIDDRDYITTEIEKKNSAAAEN
jgi:hypothetical protein